MAAVAVNVSFAPMTRPPRRWCGGVRVQRRRRDVHAGPAHAHQKGAQGDDRVVGRRHHKPGAACSDKDAEEHRVAPSNSVRKPPDGD